MGTIKGTITVIRETQKVSDKFQKREFVVKDNDKYPNEFIIQLTQENVDTIEAHKVGDKVEVSYNLRGKKWTNKNGEDLYFTTLEAWRILGEGKHSATQTAIPIQGYEDDLPF